MFYYPNYFGRLYSYYLAWIGTTLLYQIESQFNRFYVVNKLIYPKGDVILD